MSTYRLVDGPTSLPEPDILPEILDSRCCQIRLLREHLPRVRNLRVAPIREDVDDDSLIDSTNQL